MHQGGSFCAAMNNSGPAIAKNSVFYYGFFFEKFSQSTTC